MSDTNALVGQYAEVGKKWLSGYKVTEWDTGEKKISLNAKQIEFVNDKSRYCLFSGGIASGKTTGFVIKLAMLSLFFPGNRILLGRKTRANLEATTVRDFFDVVPESMVEYRMGPGLIKFFNGSEILLKGLDALQEGSEQELKKAVAEVRGLNLGGVFIDQLEEIDEVVFKTLGDRMRRDVGFRQMNFTTNPANYWAHDYFKANPRDGTKVIETSLLDNKDNLPEDFIKDRLAQPESYVKRYVFGDWDIQNMSEGNVFPQEYIKEQTFYQKTPVREFDGIKIFAEPEFHEYQIGVDPSEGAVDPCAIYVVDKDNGDVVASYSAFVPVTAIKEKVLQLAYMYSKKEKPLIVPEANSMGTALIEALKQDYSKIYEREVFNYREKKSMKKLGWVTNHGSKAALIEHFRKLLQAKFPKLRDSKLLDELRTFVYTNEAQKKGAGASNNFHDDRVISAMLAYWNVKAVSPREASLLNELKKQRNKATVNYDFE